MEMTFKNYKYKDNLLNFTIETAKINGITGKDTEELVRIINLKNTYRGKIIIDKVNPIMALYSSCLCSIE